MSATLYCPTCRGNFISQGEAAPPYGAVHVMTDPPSHVHPITREELFPA